MSPRDALRLAWHTARSDIVEVPLRVLGGRVRHETAAAAGEAGGGPRELLDVCTGTGSVLLEYARLYPGVRITAVDRDPALLELTRRRLARAGFSRVRTLEADARELPLPACSVDVANVSFGLHESARLDRGLILGECFRVLVPGGLLVVSDYREVEGRARALLMRLYLRAAEPGWVPELFSGGLEREIEAAGFEVISARTDLPLTRLLVARRGQA